jgi:hypothetical protein
MPRIAPSIHSASGGKLSTVVGFPRIPVRFVGDSGESHYIGLFVGFPSYGAVKAISPG